MGNNTNHLGNLGENIVSCLLSRKIGGRYYFAVQFLGEKCELLDFLVHLLDTDGSSLGPYFFLQVKCSDAKEGQGEVSIPARFTADEVKQAIARRVPVYLAGVRSIDDDAEDIYFLAVDSSLKQGITTIPLNYSLYDQQTRRDLYEEVKEHFDKMRLSFSSNFTRAAIRAGGDR